MTDLTPHDDRIVPASREFMPMVYLTQQDARGKWYCKLPDDKVSNDYEKWRKMDSTRVPGYVFELFKVPRS